MFAKNFRKFLMALSNTISDLAYLVFNVLCFLVVVALTVVATKGIFYVVFNVF